METSLAFARDRGLRDEEGEVMDVWGTITGRRYGDSSDDLGSALIQDVRLGHEAAHADARPGVESVFGLLPTDSQQARGELIGWQPTEPEARAG